MKNLRLRLLVFLIVLAACEPLAPEASQQVIVVTSPPTATPSASETPVFGNNIPATPVVVTAAPRFPSPSPTTLIIPTATVPPCASTTGTYFENELQSQISTDPIPYNIYLPPCFFESGRRFPYLILMHGSGYTYQQWTDLEIQSVLDSLINEGTVAPMVVVMPEGGAFQENNVFDAGVSYEDIILNELIPDIERNFCVRDGRAGRAIGGISRGGFWAFLIAFRHPELFTTVGGHSPFFAPDNAPTSHNPLALAERAIGIEDLRIYLDNPQNDNGSANVIVFSNALRSRGIIHTYIINPVGGHDNDYWGSHLSEYLEFYAQSWTTDVTKLPSCQ
ncbi:MAG TPA: alpha/beta hydrolase-fold protein [Aggregatilineales bacterium]|nr:alpha/beta hydrolase-fold protein [Aggregatilineales bacterium]